MGQLGTASPPAFVGAALARVLGAQKFAAAAACNCETGKSWFCPNEKS